MYFYFSSERKAAVKFNGIYFGLISGDVKSCDFSEDSPPLVEVIMLDGGKNLSFIPDAEFLACPKGVAVTDLKGGYMITVPSARCEAEGFSVIAQKKFSDVVATVFIENGYNVSVETPSDFFAEKITFAVERAKIEKIYSGGREFLSIYLSEKGGLLCLYDLSGKVKKVFSRAADDYSAEDVIKLTEKHTDMAKHTVVSEWRFIGGEFTETARRVSCSNNFNREKLIDAVIPYAFAEEFLVGGDYKYYLGKSVKENADKLSAYLGNFIGVMPPPRFRSAEEVGLIYELCANKYRADYFVFRTENGKIVNISKLD